MFDIAIRGGTIYSDGSTMDGDLLISGEKVSAIAPRGSNVTAREEVDASGLAVMPGFVDSHVHFREPGATHKEGVESGTAAAALGGVTTVVIMPTDQPVTSTAATVKDKLLSADGRAHVDFGVTGLLACDLSNFDEMQAAGVIGVELFMGGQTTEYRFEDPGLLLRALTALRSSKLLVGISPVDERIVKRTVANLTAAGRRDASAFAASRPPIAEASGVAQACLAAIEAGADIHLRQVSCSMSVSVIQQYRHRGLAASAEVLPHNLLLNEDLLDALGPFAVMSPPLRKDEDIASLWQAIADGVLNVIATDHAPHLPEEKERGRSDIWKAPLGVPGLQTWLPLMCDQSTRGRISLIDVVRLCSEMPARRCGLYPRKGSLQVGADADIAVVDLSRTVALKDEEQVSKARSTPFAGWQVKGFVAFTVLRGSIIVRDGVLMPGRRGRPV